LLYFVTNKDYFHLEIDLFEEKNKKIKKALTLEIRGRFII
jgi:hypothetical protein